MIDCEEARGWMKRYLLGDFGNQHEFIHIVETSVTVPASELVKLIEDAATDLLQCLYAWPPSYTLDVDYTFKDVCVDGDCMTSIYFLTKDNGEGVATIDATVEFTVSGKGSQSFEDLVESGATVTVNKVIFSILTKHLIELLMKSGGYWFYGLRHHHSLL